MKTCVIASIALFILSIEVLSWIIVILWGSYWLGKLVIAAAEHGV